VERYAPPQPVPATLGGFPVKIVDIGLTGCRVAHIDRLPQRPHLALQFLWRRAKVRLDATMVRTELTAAGGKPAYISSLEFCSSAEASPPVVRDVVGWLAQHVAPAIRSAGTDDAPDEMSEADLV
jgi:hypothetical protein